MAAFVTVRRAALLRLSVIVVVATVLGGAILHTAWPAHADSITYGSLGYPWPDATYIDANYDWGYNPCPPSDPSCTYPFSGYLGNVKYGESDPWAYYLRNCTSYVAWKLTSLGVPSTKVKGLGNGGQWADNAYKNHLIWSSAPKPGTAAVVPGNPGHVAFVEAYDAATDIITVSEYNHDMHGDGDTWIGHPATRGFSKYVDFGISPWSLALGVSANPISVGTNRDGRLEVFGVNANQPQTQNNVWHAWQLTPGGSWSPWYNMPGYLTSVAVARNADGRLELFGVNTNQPQTQNNVWHAWQLTPGGSWSSWHNMPGYLTSISAATNADGRIEIWGVNTNQPQTQSNVWHAWQLSPGGYWSAWAGVAGYLTNIAESANRDGRLEVFGVNTDQPQTQNNIWHKWQLTPGGSWSAWAGVAGYLTSVALNTNADGRLEVWGVNADQPQTQNNVWHAWQLTPGGSWSAWAGVAGYLTSISEARNGDGRLEVWGANTDQPQTQNNVWHCWQLWPGGSWSAWAGVAGYLG